MDGPETGPFNIGNPTEFTMLELAKMVQEVVNPDVKIVYKENTADDPSRRKPDISKVLLLPWLCSPLCVCVCVRARVCVCVCLCVYVCVVGAACMACTSKVFMQRDGVYRSKQICSTGVPIASGRARLLHWLACGHAIAITVACTRCGCLLTR